MMDRATLSTRRTTMPGTAAPYRVLATIFAVCLAFAVPSAPAMGQGGGAEAGLPEVGGWSLGTPLIDPISEQSVVELDGRVYIIGGYPGDRIPVSSVRIFDSATGNWQPGPPVPIELHHAMSAAVNGRIYLIGGEFQGAGTGLPAIFLNSVYELDPAAGVWTARAAMPTARSGGGAAVVDGKIYVAGGRPPGGSDFAVYDPALDQWTVLPNLPTQRNHLGMGAIDGKVYVAGGRFGGGFNSERTDALEIYDPATNTWTSGARLLSPRGGVASVEANGCLFVIGGEGNYADPRGLSVENEAYNPRTDTWISLPPMPTPTHGLVGGAFVGGLIHLPGGSVTQGTATASSLHWQYRPSLSCR
jgi:N-acetylneuraminic acid mutarotase